MRVRVAALAAADHPRWLVLAREYKAFYNAEVSKDEYERARNHTTAGLRFNSSMACALPP